MFLGSKEQEIWDEARKDHAAQIMDFLEDLTDCDHRKSLGIAWAQYENTGSTLWLSVCEGIKTLIRQEVTHPSPQLQSYLIGDDDVPF